MEAIDAIYFRLSIPLPYAGVAHTSSDSLIRFEGFFLRPRTPATPSEQKAL